MVPQDTVLVSMVGQTVIVFSTHLGPNDFTY